VNFAVREEKTNGADNKKAERREEAMEMPKAIYQDLLCVLCG
jgi:hypothetical protein